MTLFRPHEHICLDTAPDAIKQEPCGPYLKCVNGECQCRKAAEPKPEHKTEHLDWTGSC